jgi:hypothetical protein
MQYNLSRDETLAGILLLPASTGLAPASAEAGKAREAIR